MDKYDLLEAMSGIRDQYIEDASAGQENKLQETEDGRHLKEAEAAASARSSAGEGQTGGRVSRRRKFVRFTRWSTVIAALLCVSVLIPNLIPGVSSVFRGVPVLEDYFNLVTFRKSGYEDTRPQADGGESGLVTMGAGEPEAIASGEAGIVSEDEAYENAYADSAQENSAAEGDAGAAEGEAIAAEEDAGAAGEDHFDGGDLEENAPKEKALQEKAAAEEYAASGNEGDFSLQDVLSDAQISADIRSLTENSINRFENTVLKETGYGSMDHIYEPVTDTADWFCIAVTAYTFEAEGYQHVRHFVIDKSTGEQLTLRRIFGEETDYVTPISASIIEQMRAQMAEDEFAEYRLDSKDNPSNDFRKISPDQDFYLDENGDLVICFDEGEVAPLYMGVREFTIPREVTGSIR